MFIVASILSLFTFFLNSFTLNLDLKERIQAQQVVDVCATGSCSH
jgi:hypothetical protein